MPTQIHIGNSLIQDGITTFDCWRSRLDPVDILEFNLFSGLGLVIEKGSPTDFWIANFGGKLTKVFAGQIDSVGSALRARDGMVEVLKTPVYQTFLNATPQEILSAGLQLAGITDFQLSSKVFPRRNFVAAVPSVHDLIKRINQAWEIGFDAYFDTERVFHWHERPAQSTLPVFAYGQNIISLDFDDTKGTLLTVGLPEIDHSMLIGIDHPSVPATEVLVDTVHHYQGEKGGMRTEIYFSLI